MGHADWQKLLGIKNHTANMVWFNVESSYTKRSLQINCKLEQSYYIVVQLKLIL